MTRKAIKLILANESSSTFLKALYEQRKRLDPEFSLAFICEAVGIPSRGYLWSTMNQKKTIKEEYVAGVCKVFALDDVTAAAFTTLVQYERESDTKTKIEKRQLLDERKIELARHFVMTGVAALLLEVRLFSFLLTAADGMEEESLFWNFRDDERDNVTLALQSLCERGLVEQTLKGTSQAWRFAGFAVDLSLPLNLMQKMQSFTML